MPFVLIAITPIFGLIAIGAAAAYTRVLSADTGKAMSEFVFRLAVPALLFRTMLKADLSGTSVLGVWAAQFGALAIGWLIATLATTRLLGRSQAEAAVMSMSAVHGNLLLLGLPVALSAFGPAATPTVAVLLSLHAPILWLAGTLHLALASRGEASSSRAIARNLAIDLARNPIILALAAGTTTRMLGLELHPALDRLLELLAAASVPCALVALGMSLTRFRLAGEQGGVAVLLILKLAVCPLVAFVLAAKLLALPPIQVAVVTLLAAMPTGANAFLFADRYGQAVGSTSAAVAIGTSISFVSLTALIYALAPQ